MYVHGKSEGELHRVGIFMADEERNSASDQPAVAELTPVFP